MLAPEFPPVWGGVGTYTFELTRHLPKNIDIHILTPRREGFGKQKVSMIGRNPFESLGDNVRIHYISKANNSFMYNAEFQYACLMKAPNLVKGEKIDVVHSHQAHMPDLLLMFRKLPANILTTVHTTIKFQRAATIASHQNISEFENSEKATYYLYPFLRMAEELYVKRNRTYVTPSSFMAKWLKVNLPNSAAVSVIPNCVDVPEDNTNGKSDLLAEKILPEEFLDKRIILYSGRLLAMKGVDNLINAVPEISRTIGKRELLFIFAGPGDSGKYRSKLDKMDLKSDYLFERLQPLKRSLYMLNLR
jgi:glycosyltransferase involved in cell wall biosynthesis